MLISEHFISSKKAINAAVIIIFRIYAPSHAFIRRDRLLRFPPWGMYFFSCARKEYPGMASHSHKGALRCGFFATPFIINRVALIVAKGLRSLWRHVNLLKT